MVINVRSFVRQCRYQRVFRSSVSYCFISNGETLMSYKHDANFRDHWDDKAGYANLAADNIKPSMPQIAADINEVLQTEQQQ